MSTIKPPGGPAATPPVAPIDPAAPTEGAEGAREVEGAQGPRGVEAASTDPTERVIASLKAGEITPEVAVDRLVTAAVDKTGCPPALRPAVEAKMRALILSDPNLRALTRQMGVSPASED